MLAINCLGGPCLCFYRLCFGSMHDPERSLRLCATSFLFKRKESRQMVFYCPFQGLLLFPSNLPANLDGFPHELTNKKLCFALHVER